MCGAHAGHVVTSAAQYLRCLRMGRRRVGTYNGVALGASASAFWVAGPLGECAPAGALVAERFRCHWWTGYWLLVYWLRVTGGQVRGCEFLDSCCWLRVIGYWLLATTYWFLAIGYE